MSSVTGLRARIDRTSQINRPLTIPDADEMYHPTLKLDSALSKPSFRDAGHRLMEQVSSSNRFSNRSRIVVSMEGRTAILRGEVTSARERDLAELVALVEPGISRVRNELKLAKPLVPPPPRHDSEDSASEPPLPPPPAPID